MSDFINRMVEQFRSKSQQDKFIAECQLKFDINTYRFQHLTRAMARKGYHQLEEKYEQHKIQRLPRDWHQNERKLFVWFLLAFIRTLKQNNSKIEQQHWEELSETFFGKDILFLKYQFNAIQKNRKRHQWTEQQDQILKQCEQQIENTNWNQIAKQIFFKTDGKCFKSSKQCRQRWQNHLDHKIKRDQWSAQEDLIILKYVLQNGKKWSKMVEQLDKTRTEHMVKNRFKSLNARGIAQFKESNRKWNNQQEIVAYLINDIQSKNISSDKNSFVDKKSSLENGSEMKDIVYDQLIQPALNGRKISNYSGGIHGCYQINLNGQVPQYFTTRSTPGTNIYQSRSPATVSYNSSKLNKSGPFFTPGQPTGTNFISGYEVWNKVLQKDSDISQRSSMTKRYIDCGRNQSNVKFSQQLNAIQNGPSTPRSFTPTLYQNIENMLFGNVNNDKFFLENSQHYTSTLNSKIQPRQKQNVSQSQVLQKQK